MIKKSYGVTKITIGGDIFFDGINLKEIAYKYNTPFFIFSERQLTNNYKNFLKAFSEIPDFKVFYSIKTNFESEVLRTLQKLGSGAEVGGGLDLFATTKANFSPENIIFDGPCKEKGDVCRAIDLDIHCFNIESFTEAEELEKVASSNGKSINIGIRIDPLVDRAFYDKMIDTYKRKFGFPITEAERVFQEVYKKFSHLNLIAVHAHIGSQITKISMYQESVNKIFKLIYNLKKKGINIKEINIGGGFPIQSMKTVVLPQRIKISQFLDRLGMNLERKTPSIFDFGKALSKGYKENSTRYNLSPSLHAEPGRCIVSNAGVLVGKVLFDKREWLFTDISVNDLAENIFFAERQFGFPGKMNQEAVKRVNISGPTLATADIVYLNEMVPEVKKGDVIVIFDAGAYSISRSNQFTRPRKATYFKTEKGEIKLMRAAETYEDVTKTQIW